jgi:hypothetical protein
MLSCKEFVEQQNQKLDGFEFSFGQRMSQKMHYFMCIHCRRYLKQLQLVDAVGKQIPTYKVSAQKVEDCLNHLNNQQTDAEK